jgi:hypothetical protein
MPKNKTLIGGLKGGNELKCDDLRDYEAPPEVQVFKATPDWLHVHSLGECIKTEPPTIIDCKPNFNGRKKR